MTTRIRLVVILATVAAASLTGGAQGPGQPPQGRPPQGQQGGPMRMGGPGMQAERKVVAQFDKDGDGRLNTAERREARTWLERQPQTGPGRGRMGGRGGAVATGSPGERLTPADVKKYGNENFYDSSVLRTLFLDFENADWEKELEIFSNTDVEVPATLTVDGRVYKEVGVHFRGMSSFFTVPAGLKRSLNVAVDWVHEQSVGGYRTLNLLNSHVDPTYTRTALYMEAAREYIPAPKVNHTRVVLNGESWGIYVNAQQFNKDLINEWFKTQDGARWKVPGSPGGRGGLEYLGDDPEPYKRVYEIKSKDNRKSWAALVQLCKVLDTAPPEQLEKALAPILDIDATLKFLALDVTLVNGDGYWTRASDYSIYLDTKGRFHVIPHDANEMLGPGGGRGMGGRMGPPPPPGATIPPPGAAGPQRRGGPGGGGPELDPLIGLNDATKPLRSRLLAVPALRERYLGYVRQIATRWLDWKTLEPRVRQYQALIAEDVRKDTRKLDTVEAFQNGVDAIKAFAERRRTYLVNYK
jgi:hypothetical protein